MVACNSRAIVFVNGELGPRAVQRAGIEANDFIVCVDGGLDHVQALGLQPHLLVGDFDSATPKAVTATGMAHVERIEHPTNKDASDLELTLQALQSRQFREVILLGVSGGRTDHSLFNWFLPAVEEWSYRLRLIDESVDAQLVNRNNPFASQLNLGDLVSLLPLGEVTGVSTEGLEYPLSGASIRLGSTLGLSNVAVARSISVRLASGSLLVLNNY